MKTNIFFFKDQDHDTRVSFEDFKTSIHDDNLLLECFGRCLPNLPVCN